MTAQELTEPIDFNELARYLQTMCRLYPPFGRDAGHERLTKMAVLLLGCSLIEAKQAIDLLVLRRQLVYCQDNGESGVWRFGRAPARC